MIMSRIQRKGMLMIFRFSWDEKERPAGRNRPEGFLKDERIFHPNLRDDFDEKRVLSWKMFH